MSVRRHAVNPALVVEDDATLGAVIGAALEDEGFHPVTCVDLASARTSMRRMNFSVIVLDLSVGTEFATDLLDELSTRDDSPAVVVCSAFPLAEMVASRYGLTCVRKPFDLDALLAAVDRAIEANQRPQRAAV